MPYGVGILLISGNTNDTNIDTVLLLSWSYSLDIIYMLLGCRGHPFHTTVRLFNFKQASHLYVKGKFSKSLRCLICSPPQSHSVFLFWFYLNSPVSAFAAGDLMPWPTLASSLVPVYPPGVQWLAGILPYIHQSSTYSAHSPGLSRFLFGVPSLSSSFSVHLGPPLTKPASAPE